MGLGLSETASPGPHAMGSTAASAEMQQCRALVVFRFIVIMVIIATAADDAVQQHHAFTALSAGQRFPIRLILGRFATSRTLSEVFMSAQLVRIPKVLTEL